MEPAADNASKHHASQNRPRDGPPPNTRRPVPVTNTIKKQYWPRPMPYFNHDRPPSLPERIQRPPAPAPVAPRFTVAVPASPATRTPEPALKTEDVVTSDLLVPVRTTEAPPVPPSKRATPPVQAPSPARLDGSVSRRGRPRGWRPGMSYSTMRGNTYPSRVKVRHAKDVAGEAIKRRGRPPKMPSPPPGLIYHSLRPDFLAFLCEWSGCEAELHNLETLRRHVYKVHDSTEEEHCACLWGDCAKEQVRFTSTDELRAHIEETHLVPMGWQVGDGPENSSGWTSGKLPEKGEMPDYLFDEQGNQVTPSIAGQEVEDLLTWRDNRRKLRELLKRRDENLPREESDESDEDEGGLVP